MPARTDVLDEGRDTVRIWVGMTTFSILCHVLFFFGVLYLPEFRFTRPEIPFAVEVDLVSLPQVVSESQGGPGQASLSPQAEVKGGPVEAVKPAEQPEPPRPAKELETARPREKPVETRPEKVSDKPVSMAPPPLQVKRSLKQETYNASKVIRSAIAKIEKEAPRSRPSSVVQAIGKLKKDVERHGGVITRGDMAGRGVSKKTLQLLDIYNAEIWHRIQKNWAFSEEMVQGRTDLEATIIVKIMRKGEIRHIWFENRSGNTYFDDSVFKAVKKSDPLPPLPEGYLGPFYDVGFRFNLSESQRGF